jgi:hypothetical protein
MVAPGFACAGTISVTDGTPKNGVAVVLVPFAVVSVMGATGAPEGTTAVTRVGETFVNRVAAKFPNHTPVVPLNPSPFNVTTLPAAPPTGVNPVIRGNRIKAVGIRNVPPGVVTESVTDCVSVGTTAVTFVGVTSLGTTGMPPNETTVAPSRLVPRNVTVSPIFARAGCIDCTIGWR